MSTHIISVDIDHTEECLETIYGKAGGRTLVIAERDGLERDHRVTRDINQHAVTTDEGRWNLVIVGLAGKFVLEDAGGDAAELAVHQLALLIAGAAKARESVSA